MAKTLPLLLLLMVVSAAGESAAAEGAPGYVELGKKTYTANCASCHGTRAEGAPNWQRPDALGELPPPPHNSDGHTWRHSDQQLFMMIADGWRDPFNKTERLTMPAFGDVLRPTEITAVIDYLKSLWTPDQVQFQREKSAESPSVPVN